MIMKKWLLMTGTALSLSMLGACDQTEDEPVEEPNQEETEQSDETMEEDSTDEENGQSGENSEEDTDEPSSDNKEDAQTDALENDDPQLDLEDDILNPASIAALVNKQYSLPEDYTPKNLVTVNVPTVLPNPEIKQMRQVAADALKEMFDAAEEEGVILHARSGYRSYETQVQLFRNYASNHGEEAANKYSARAGESEHQTGLVMDITSESVNLQITSDFGETEEGQWVRDNAHTFGFIIRYPEGKSDITGYVYEPWHLRYLGEELATDVYESGLTYEEYLVERGLDIEI